MERVIALVDTGADACFIRDDIAKSLALPYVAPSSFRSLRERFDSDAVRAHVQVGSVISRR